MFGIKRIKEALEHYFSKQEVAKRRERDLAKKQLKRSNKGFTGNQHAINESQREYAKLKKKK